MTERIWANEASIKYPKQWIVMTNLSWEPTNKVYGNVYFVTSEKKEAYQKLKELKASESMGKVMVVPGFDDTPQIGGLEICKI
jgi:hypothetical protein